MLATLACTLLGAALLALALRDIFDSLFHPEGHSRLSRFVARRTWSAVSSLTRTRQGLAVAGPLAVFAVIGAWARLFVLAFALIYLPHVASAFEAPGGLPRELGSRCVEAVAFSLQVLTTLGFSDLVPEAPWLRILAPFEALIGFGLLSASISWLLTAQPVLARRRELAYELYLAMRTAGFDEAGFAHDVAMLVRELVPRLVVVERDLVAFPVTFYFAVSDERFSLAAALPALERARTQLERGRTGPAEVREHVRVLGEALDDLAATIASHLRVAGLGTAAVFDAYARAHRVRPWIGAEQRHS